MTDVLAAAWLSVTRHRLRSLLAMAGVAVGVCALTSIMSVEQSWRKAVIRFFSAMDLQTVRVSVPGWLDWREAGLGRGRLEPADVEAMARLPAVQSATYLTWRTRLAEADDGTTLELTVRAVAADFTKTLPDEVREGRLFTAEEVARRAPVCVLSAEARVRLFGTDPVIGRHVRLEGSRFQVIGVIAGNRHLDVGARAVYIPDTWSRAVFQSDSAAAEIYVHAADPKAASDQIEKLMRAHIGGDGSRPYTHSLWEVRRAALHARDRATAYSALAGLCALLAAGFGIASLLFVSVAERSREIGIHRALGAPRVRIYAEYLVASLLLCGGGAVIGALVGIPAAATGAFSARWQPVLDPLAGQSLGGQHLPRLSELAISVSWEAAAIAAGLALVAGATAAVAPASEAASLSPALVIAQRGGTSRGTRRVLTCLQVAFGVVVLVVLTSYFALLDSEEKAEARRTMGEDKVSAAADPIAARREPVEPRLEARYRDALVAAVGTPEALARLQRQTPLLTRVAPYAVLPLGVARGGRTLDLEVTLTSAEAFACEPELTGDAGVRTAEAFRAGEPVAVIDPGAQQRLFGTRNPIGQRLLVSGTQFTVIAVRRPPPGTTGAVEVWVPVQYYAALRPRLPQDEFPARARVDGWPIDPRRYAEALAQLRDALLPVLPKEYRNGILLSADIPETTKQFIFQSAAVARRGAIGALAVLLVALIGLANMLLVSVHDEVRETGLQRAFGATRPDVFLHFLSQGVLLSALGACAGLAVGTAICALGHAWAGMPLSVSAFWAAAGAVATVLAGTLTSMAPAFVATRIHPVEALRYE